jgi:hypothetical protein
MRINPLRSLVAIVGGVLLLNFMSSTLQSTLVSVVAQATPADEAAYLAVRNRPAMLGISLVTHVLAATLAGYIIARVSGVHEVRHAMAAAALLAVAYASTFMTENAMLPPAWMRVAMLILTPPALVAGAYVRAEARAIHAEGAGAVRPQEERR